MLAVGAVKEQQQKIKQHKIKTLLPYSFHRNVYFPPYYNISEIGIYKQIYTTIEHVFFFSPQIRAIHNRDDLSETKKTKLSQLDLFRISGID